MTTLGNKSIVDEHAAAAEPPGSDDAHPRRLLIIGGGADRCCGTGVLERFAGPCGGTQVWILAPFQEVLADLGDTLSRAGGPGAISP
jgi:hypothetical protein